MGIVGLSAMIGQLYVANEEMVLFFSMGHRTTTGYRHTESTAMVVSPHYQSDIGDTQKA